MGGLALRVGFASRTAPTPHVGALGPRVRQSDRNRFGPPFTTHLSVRALGRYMQHTRTDIKDVDINMQSQSPNAVLGAYTPQLAGAGNACHWGRQMLGL